MGIQQEARISSVTKAGKGSDDTEGLISGPDNGNPPAIPVATYDDPSQVDPSNIVDRDDGLGAGSLGMRSSRPVNSGPITPVRMESVRTRR